MGGPYSTKPPPSREAGGDGAWGPSLYWLAIALAIVAGGVGVLLMSSRGSAPPAPDTARATRPVVVASTSPLPLPMPATVAASESMSAKPVHSTQATSPLPPAEPPRISRRVPDADSDQTPDLSDYVNQGETPTMAEVIERLHMAGVYSGLGAFSPPGTRPPLVGLAVPEDFELPQGYVRHHQATDDGQRIEPILMFSPDVQLVDAAQRPVAIPDDRVVPPELAPPGLPLRRIAIPAPTQPERPAR